MSSSAGKNLGLPEARTLFSIYDPHSLQQEVEQAAREVVHELGAKPLTVRTGIGDLEYLVDQLRFFKAALAQASRRGLTGLAQLEWAEYLSWPESLR